MGTWGTAIGKSDIFQEVCECFNNWYQESDGKTWTRTFEETMTLLQHELKSTFELEDVSNEAWFGLAKAQWNFGVLQDHVKEKVKEIIQTGKDLEAWKRLNASDKDLKIRQENLNKFLSLICSINPKVKARKKIQFFNSPFLYGDVLAIDINDGFWYAGIVNSSSNGPSNICSFSIVFLNYCDKKKPSMNEIMESAFFNLKELKKTESTLRERCLFSIKDFKKSSSTFEKIGQVNFKVEQHGYVSFSSRAEEEMIEFLTHSVKTGKWSKHLLWPLKFYQDYLNILQQSAEYLLALFYEDVEIELDGNKFRLSEFYALNYKGIQKGSNEFLLFYILFSKRDLRHFLIEQFLYYYLLRLANLANVEVNFSMIAVAPYNSNRDEFYDPLKKIVDDLKNHIKGN